MLARARRRAATLLPIGVIIVSTFAATLIGGSAGAAGYLPPANPPGNIAPSSGDWLTAINSAAAQEGVAAMPVSEAQLASLPLAEQVFTVVNDERIGRGEAPIDYLTSQLNAVAQAGANAGRDPSFPGSLSGGAPVTWGGAIWAGGLTSVLEADYYWMYDDGWGGALSSTTNIACTLATPTECWGHRDIMLNQFPNCPAGAPILSMGAAFSPSGYSGGSIAAILVSSCSAPSDATMTWGQVSGSVASASRTVGIAPLSNGSGYWEAQADGTVAAFGNAQNLGSVNVALSSPIVGIAATPDGGGYWLVGTDGGIFSFGDAVFRGSMGGQSLNQPIVGMASDPATDGYWLVAADGGVFSYGAPFLGSTGNIHLNRPIVGMEATANGKGYRFVASDGGIFSFGQAPFDGSTGNITLVAPVVGIASDAPTNGYWMAAEDGGIFTFGGASYMGRIVSAA